MFLELQLILLGLYGHLVVGCPYDPAVPEQGVTCPVLTAGARRNVFIFVEYFMIFLLSLPTPELLVAVLISFLIKEEQTSHFA